MLRQRGVAMFDVLRHRISTGRILHHVPTQVLHTPKLRQKKKKQSVWRIPGEERVAWRRATREDTENKVAGEDLSVSLAKRGE